MKDAEILALLIRSGALLESADGPVPNVAELVAGEKIQGKWWSHPAAHRIFRVTRFLRSSPEVLTCCFLGGKITFVHRRLWPALVRLSDRLDVAGLSSVRDVHTDRGSHRRETTAFPDWVPTDILRAAASLSEDEAESALEGVLVSRDALQTLMVRRPTLV